MPLTAEDFYRQMDRRLAMASKAYREACNDNPNLKVYLAPSSFTPGQGLGQLRDAGVQYVVLTRYGPPLPSFRHLEQALDRDAHRIATFSPYRDGRDPSDAPVPPFRHTGTTGRHPRLAGPGPFVEIGRVELTGFRPG